MHKDSRCYLTRMAHVPVLSQTFSRVSACPAVRRRPPQGRARSGPGSRQLSTEEPSSPRRTFPGSVQPCLQAPLLDSCMTLPFEESIHRRKGKNDGT